MFRYNICTQADNKIFEKQCKAIEKHIPNIQKEVLLVDVDGSQTQSYKVNGKTLSVHNSYYVDAVYIESQIDIEKYFN